MKGTSPGGLRPVPLAASALAALGVVFGDIGTSPLYAFRECFASGHGAPPDPANLTGAASLILWSLVVVVSLKYLFIILRLDNSGEGGILALSALIRRASRRLGGADPKAVLMLGLAGSALIYADGMLTPAISVLSAVEGLSVSAPMVEHWIVPAAVVILLGLFAIQRHGTGIVGRFFGPVVVLWFLSLAVFGVRGILMHPEVLGALSPHEGVAFLIREWRHSLPLLGAVFLAVTGGEALYADLGHFGPAPIRLAWFVVVFPSLVLNYLGQAALLGADPSALRSPFFLLAPEVLRFPLTLLATAAAVIASQALISGAFSLTTQAVQLGCLPRIRIDHTSDHEIGQVFVPSVNRLLALSCVLLVVVFKSSSELAGAYGIAIALTMAITSVLFFSAAHLVFGWAKWKAGIVTLLFLLVDGAFLVANGMKVLDNGWLPLAVAAGVIGIMLTWIWGRARLYEKVGRTSMDVTGLIDQLKEGRIPRVEGLAVYMSGRLDTVPVSLLHNLKHNRVLHGRVILLHVETVDSPRVPAEEAVRDRDLGEGVHSVTLRFGFAETPDVPEALKRHLPAELRFNPMKASYFLGRETYAVGRASGRLDLWRLRVFSLLASNSSSAVDYFHLPRTRVVELGAHMTL